MSLDDRYKQSYQTKKSGDRISEMNYNGDVKFYKPKSGRNSIIIVPYKIKSDKHPNVALRKWKIGSDDYLMDLWVHMSINKSNLTCLKKNYNKKCPICEEIDDARSRGEDEKVMKKIRAKRRVYYNVVDMDRKEEGVQIFSVSHYLFESELIEEAVESVDDENGVIKFAEIENGKIITFRAVEKQLDNNNYFEFKSFRFIDRKEGDFNKKWLDDVISFDEAISIHSYDEMKQILYGVDYEEDNDNTDSTTNDNNREEKSKSKSNNTCPSGHEFGADYDEYPEDCDECDEKTWVKCKDFNK